MRDITNLNDYRQSLRHRIIENAMQLFWKHGIRAVKMDDVAHSLSISKRTLYEIFSTKEEVLLEGLTTYRQQHAEELGQQLGCCRDVMDILLYVYRDKIEEFRRVNPVFFSDLQLYPEVMLSFESDRERQHKEFLDFMQRGVNEGFFPALGNYLMTNELYRTYSIEYLFRNMVFVTLRGLCTKKGADRLDTFL